MFKIQPLISGSFNFFKALISTPKGWGFLFFFLMILCQGASAQVMPKVTLGLDKAEKPEDVAVTLEIVALLTVLTLAPSIIIMMTSFLRIVIVLNFVKQALGTQNAPPNQVVMGLSMFLTFFIMSPVFSEMNQKALQPYMAKQISFESLYKEGSKPLKNFMLRQTGENELALFVRMSKAENPKTVEDVSFWVVVPAFMLSELKTAFIIGFLIFIPFLVIDMVVSSVLMAMGMMMLPPMMVSTPFKLILFVLVDGWTLIVKQLVLSFH